jgi:hypothetical protein
MANIYEAKSEDLHLLIERASGSQGATVVIPDLQRPYVWDPTQVILLIDSLIRGWPFGTLLMWKVAHNDLGSIPHREFWQVVDRTGDAAGASVNRRDPPASYHMVLDGQQRVQSLLLALCGDGWGFKQEDRKWLEQLEGIPPRGRRPTNPHWSKATLCFDVVAFVEAFAAVDDVIAIDYRGVLRWMITDPNGGQSTWKKPLNYREPLEKAFTPENRGRFIRLGRLWNEVQPNPNFKERQFKESAKKLLEDYTVPSALIDRALGPLAELMTVLRDVKLSKITYLELHPFDPSLWSEDDYNESIVNIFTRLNTAGRTLTREEISFAWLKVGWDDQATSSETAGVCFDKLHQFAVENGLPIEMDDVVRSVSFIWAASFRDGSLLSDKDLLKGGTVLPMARDLSQHWKEVNNSLSLIVRKLSERNLRFGQNAQFNSLNSVIVLWAVVFNAYKWLKLNSQSHLNQDAFDKSLAQALTLVMDRWIVCSQWAGLWTNSVSMAKFAKELASDQPSYINSQAIDAAIAVTRKRLDDLINALVTDAATYVQQMNVDRREQVSRYNTMLWLWHRLDESRWQASQVQLRIGKHKSCDLDVDHCVAFSLWCQYIDQLGLSADDYEKRTDYSSVINSIGNCTLLEKSFNISKSAQSFREFLRQVHDFKDNDSGIDAWAVSLGLTDNMISPSFALLEEIKTAILQRETLIREELVAFVRGNKTRVDIEEFKSQGSAK